MAGVRAQGLFGGPQQNTMAAALKAQGGAAIGQGIQVALSGLAAGITSRAARQERENARADAKAMRHHSEPGCPEHLSLPFEEEGADMAHLYEADGVSVGKDDTAGM